MQANHSRTQLTHDLAGAPASLFFGGPRSVSIPLMTKHRTAPIRFRDFQALKALGCSCLYIYIAVAGFYTVELLARLRGSAGVTPFYPWLDRSSAALAASPDA